MVDAIYKQITTPCGEPVRLTGCFYIKENTPHETVKFLNWTF